MSKRDYSDSEFSDEEEYVKPKKQNRLNLNDSTCFIRAEDKLMDNKKYQEKINSRKNNLFLNQFDDLKYDHIGQPNSENTITKNNLDRDLKSGFSKFGKSDMTYNVVPKKDFVHNNMIPFFSAKGYGNDCKDMGKVFQRKMEEFTGDLNNLEYRPKTERLNLFDPSVGLTKYIWFSCYDRLL